MSKTRMGYFGAALAVIFVCYWGWKLTSRNAYESAEYSVVEADGDFEIRCYPDLMLATTSTNLGSQGSDGSFMRLFNYISGSNEEEQKVAMTTPVFMESNADGQGSQMGFVIPVKVTQQGIPEPSASNVDIRKRSGGKFAVVRFPGQLNSQARRKHTSRLREWMDSKHLIGAGDVTSAGYDPPFVPGFLRRNEILVRLAQES